MMITRISKFCWHLSAPVVSVLMGLVVAGRAEADEGAAANAPPNQQPPIPGALQLQMGPSTDPVRLSVDVKDITPKPSKKPDPVEPLNAPSLLKYGVSIGLAAAFSLPSAASRHGIGVSAMPYVAMFPAYWRDIGEETREYCAAHALYMNHRDAQRRADSLARYNAGEDYTEDLERRDDGKKHCRPGTKCVLLQPGGAASDSPALEFDKVDADAAVEQYREWTPGVPGRCFWKKIGLYLGLPTKFTTGYGVDSAPATNYPKISLGVAIAPAAYVNLLLGATYGDAEVPAMSEGMKTKLESYWQFTLSLGGTADIVGTLVSKLAGS